MINEVWHDPQSFETRRSPLYPMSFQDKIEIWIGTRPREMGQSVWLTYQEFDSSGNLIPDENSVDINPDGPPNPVHYIKCNWRYNSNNCDNSFWCAEIGPFSKETRKVIYNIFARQGKKVVTISSPDFFDFEFTSPFTIPPIPAPRDPVSNRGGAWTCGAKEGTCTAFSDKSHVWFSHSKGTINEIYYPQLDNPDVKDFQFLVLDNNGNFNDPKIMDSDVAFLDVAQDLYGDQIPRSLAYRITNKDTGGGIPDRARYELIMDTFTDPGEHSVLIGLKYVPKCAEARNFRIFALINPSINNGGRNDACKFVLYNNLIMFLSWENGIYCAMAVNKPLLKFTCGYSGFNDGWQQLKKDKDLTMYTSSDYGDIVGTMELDLPEDSFTATVSISFGQSEQEALDRAYRTVSKDLSMVSDLFINQWNDYLIDLEQNGSLLTMTQNYNLENRKLAYVSTMCIKAMEDKIHKGAIIASMSIPWGDCRDGYYGGYHDSNAGGYHLVWGRDLYNMATAAMAVGDFATAKNIVKYFDNVLQETNGSMPQNTWIDGTFYWGNEQLDETAYPIIIAWRLKKLGKLDSQEISNLYSGLVLSAANFLSSYSDTWTQDRWEEVIGRSPFTVATVVSALVVASLWADERHNSDNANKWRDKALDFATNDLRDCYVNRMGKEYFARIYNPWDGYYSKFMDVIDAGFLELVRLGVMSPHCHEIRNSLNVVDSSIRTDLGAGLPYFLRYGRVDRLDAVGKDTYGEKDDGHCWTCDNSGRGRLWPFLSGERGHYELLNNNHDLAKRCLMAITQSANKGYMLPEQIWDGEKIHKDEHGHPLNKGSGTKSATPLGWTHGEFIKLMRSISDGQVFDYLPEVAQFFKENNIYEGIRINDSKKEPVLS